MFRHFVMCTMVILLWLFIFTTSTYAGVRNFDFEVNQVISETKQVANFIKKAGGEKDANRLIKCVRAVEDDFKAGKREKLLKSLKALRAEVVLRHAYLNIALAYLVGKQNTKTEVKALQFINRAEYILKSIEKRINKIIGDR